MPQTTVTSVPSQARPGQLVDGRAHDAMTGYVDLAGGIAPGLLVTRTATADDTGELPDGAATLDTNVLGVSLHSHKGLVDPASADNEVYEDGCPLPLLRHGVVWVTAENAVTPDDPVYARVASGAGGTQIGAFRTGADTASAVAWTAARFVTSADAGALVQLEVNI